jgi:hypothetical protein
MLVVHIETVEVSLLARTLAGSAKCKLATSADFREQPRDGICRRHIDGKAAVVRQFGLRRESGYLLR